MFQIKLLILLLINISIISCSKYNSNINTTKYSLAYIAGEYDGLLLKNYLTNFLKSTDIYDKNSKYKIHANINHSTNLYITNANKTSSREKILSNLKVTIYDKDKDCSLFESNYSLSQFYIFASSDQFLSNQKAVKKIKKNNTEALVKKFFNEIDEIDLTCDK